MNRIGAAYGALGSLGDEIGGDAGALPAIEAGLWGSAAPRSLASDSAGGCSATSRGCARFSPTPRSTRSTYATRAHEILEDVQRDRLTLGRPSDSGVRATADGVAATRVVLATLTPLLNGRGDALSPVAATGCGAWAPSSPRSATPTAGAIRRRAP